MPVTSSLYPLPFHRKRTRFLTFSRFIIIIFVYVTKSYTEKYCFPSLISKGGLRLSPAIYIQVNLVSALLCLLLYYEQKKYHAFGFLGTSTFNALLWFTISILVVDSFSWLVTAGVLPCSTELLMFSRCIYYFLQALLPLLFMDYIAKTCGYHASPFLKAIRILPMIYMVVVLILNFNRHFAFRVENNQFFRAEGFLYSILAPLIYIIVSLLFSLIAFVRAQAERKAFSRNLFFSVLITLGGAALSSVVPGTSPWHIFVFALLYLYMQLHGAQERNLDFLAYRDSLTGLKNFAAYSHLKLEVEKKLSTNPDFRFALAIMDINDLKKTNDIHGHAAGNELIRSAAKIICDTFCHSPVCRIGGDEFIAILENSDYENRAALEAKFDELLASTTFEFDGQQFPISVALGISAYQPELHQSYDDVLEEADKLMYDNKALRKKT